MSSPVSKGRANRQSVPSRWAETSVRPCGSTAKAVAPALAWCSVVA